jgi:hypothetical protein
VPVSLAPRNAPCPCGSGRKYKKCCGFDRNVERALEDRLATIEEIARLAFRSPRLLPLDAAYDDWVRAVLAGEIDAQPEDAVATLGSAERRRIVEACCDQFPGEWSELSKRCGDEAAVEALIGGSVVAGIRDYAVPGEFELGLIEGSDALESDPFQTLAICFQGDSLWSPEEGREADRPIAALPDWLDDNAYELWWENALRTTAASLVTDWHRLRLAQLVRRIEAQLPFAGFPRASAAIETGCKSFADDDAFRARLAATLLSDMVGREQLLALRTALAA